MSSPSSCFRCSRAEAILSPGGLCRECAATDATAEPTPAEQPRPELDSAGATVTNHPPVHPSEGPTALPPGSATASAPAGGFAVLPESPPGFVLVRHLGEGGMGDVYLARECPSGRFVALKFLKRPESPAAYQRFVTELQVLAELNHPNIVGVLASDFMRAAPFFTMPCATGGSLADSIKPDPDEPPRLPPPEEAVRIIKVIAGAVAAANAKGIVHRDLKPANVLLFGLPGQWDALKIADFGLAKRLGDEDGFTATEDALGTPGYMAPEQVSRANGDTDCRTDVYGLGATLYCLLTGRAPFVGRTKFDIIAQVLADAPERPRAPRPEVPLALEAICLKCLAKDPAERYPSVNALLAALADYEQLGYDRTARQMTRLRRARLWAGRNRRGIGAAATVLLVVASALAVGAVYLGDRRPIEAPKEKEPDALARMQRELTNKTAVTLIPDAGKPAWAEWPVGAPTLGTSPTGDGTCSFEALAFAMLELCPDPMTDRYRFRAELRHTLSKGGDEVSSLGLYFARSGLTGNNGMQCQRFLAVAFSELPKVAVPPGKLAQFRRLALIQQPNKNSELMQGGIRNVKYLQADRMPGPWRPIEIEVTPEGVKVFWPNEHGQMVPFGDLTAEAVRAEYAKLDQKIAPLPPGHGLPVPAWKPRMPLGVWANRAAVDVRNVVLTPLR